MPISYAGVNLLLEDRDIETWIEENLPTGDLFHQAESLAPVVNYPDPPRIRLQTLYRPTGAGRWGWFYGLIDTAGKVAIEQAVSTTKSAYLAMSDGSTSLTTTMYLLPIRNLTGRAASDLWLVPLVDQRYWWQFLTSGDLTLVQGTTTWSTLISSIASNAGVSITVDGVDSDYQKPDPSTFNHMEHVPIGHALDLIAYSLGLRIVLEIDDTIRMMNFTNAETLINQSITSYTASAGTTFGNSRSQIPAQVQVSFPKLDQYVPLINGDRYSYNKDPSAYGATDYTPGTKKIIRSSAYAEYTTGTVSGSPNNNSTLDSLASQIAADYYASLKHIYDWNFNGIQAWSPNAFDDSAIWSLGRLRPSEEGKGGRSAFTRVQSMGHNVGVQEMAHQDGSLTIYDDTIKKGVSDINIVSSGPVSIWENGSDSGDNVTGHHNWMQGTNIQIDHDREVLVKYFRDERKWVAIGAECNT